MRSLKPCTRHNIFIHRDQQNQQNHQILKVLHTYNHSGALKLNVSVSVLEVTT